MAAPPAQTLTEDDMYRTSTQFRLWSFSESALLSLRQNTHEAALQQARSYLSESDLSSLPTAYDELRLVQRYCDQVRSTSDFFQWSVNVKATAVQYLKRFYTTNSVITYPPKEIYKSVLFLASKTEGVHMSLSEYARRIKTDPKNVLAPEYKIIQALRFTLDVRQPFRALKGCFMDLLNLAEGNGAPLPFLSTTPSALQSQMCELPPPPPGSRTQWQPPQSIGPKEASDRAHCAYGIARHILDAPALLTDVYFLFTPPQIYLAALKLSDPILFTFYLSTKIPATSPSHDVIISTISQCADMMASFDNKAVMSKDERADLEARLEVVRDPSTRDLIKKHENVKRGGLGEGEIDGEKAERKKLAREKSFREGEDLFGPALSVQQKR
ncbi:cyclin-like protein [Aureobasidium namibiae CBS 147.97]|uniref:RNA polymerase II holoenzyme cyclin-like subunit n=1 Tax=Aureobasidium namibiae CBS 147.97 TaxID=1043004 RepID=A0A074X843_9PEZI